MLGLCGLDVGVDELGGLEELREDGLEGVDGEGLVRVPHVLGGLDAVAVAGPLLLARVLWLDEHAEEVVPVLGPRLFNDGHGVGLVPAGEVEEVGLLAVGVEDGAGLVLQGGGVEDGDAAGGEGVSEGGAAVGVFLGGDAGGDFAGFENVRVGFMDRLAELEVGC